jgi:hypothetical protein
MSIKMTRKYEVTVEIHNYNPQFVNDIKNAICFTEQSNCTIRIKSFYLFTMGIWYINSEEEFSEDLALAIWKANKEPCRVDITTTLMEDLPFDVFSYGVTYPPRGWNK